MKNSILFKFHGLNLENQCSIVAKVDHLMSLCDKLEAGLMRSQADSERLMEAVVGRMLAGGDSDGEHGAGIIETVLT